MYLLLPHECSYSFEVLLKSPLIGRWLAGYKVGVIEQLETAAEAKKRDAKKALVRRELTAIETVATNASPVGYEAVFLLCINTIGTTGLLPTLKLCRFLQEALTFDNV